MMHKFILNQEQRPIYSMQFFLHDRTKVLVRRPFYSMNSFTDLLTIRGRRGRDRMVVEFTKEEAQLSIICLQMELTFANI
jgi:hypothetical protein